MSGGRPRRVMWLLNHKAAREFEIPMLKRVGFQEIFLPKSFPQDHNFRSADVDRSEDRNLTIPSSDLEKLNATNWYAPVPRDIWEIANRHFDLAFFTLHNLDAVERMAASFHGAMLLRAFGLVSTTLSSYNKLLELHAGAHGALSQARHRLWLAEAYRGIGANEGTWLGRRSVYLPLGLAAPAPTDKWVGTDNRLMFICPDIEFNPYYHNIYKRFLRDFKKIPYIIGGAQLIPVKDSDVTGFLPAEEFKRYMRELKVMFYHSSEPRHVHYHPFEAVRTGMPLVFMAGGVLEKLAGRPLPGQAKTTAEARTKIERILRGDRRLIDSIRESQTVLLDAMAPAHLEPYWHEGLHRILANLDEQRLLAAEHARRRKKVAVIVPLGYRGGSMRAAKLVAEALLLGSRQYGEEAQIVLAHLEEPGIYSEREFDDLAPSIQLRPFQWQEVDASHARDAMKLAQHDGWKPKWNKYQVPDDGINHLLDCDVWVIVSDRVDCPILPMRPRVHIIYDYIQRYIDIMESYRDWPFLNAALDADHILVTTEFSRKDTIQYAGVNPDRVTKMPMLAPRFKKSSQLGKKSAPDYFLWTTNVAPHKNHERALQALSIYYGELNGGLHCYVTGVDSERLLQKDVKHLKEARKVYRGDPNLSAKVKFLGELPDKRYQSLLAQSAFLWHPGLIDNGTFSVIEAAYLGVPSLSSDYPAMREIDRQFALNLTMFKPTDIGQMAEKLKWMEENFSRAREILPEQEILDSQDVSKLAGAYWAEVREWL
ncbi:glycosyltransferase [Chelativorans sp. AA-79]|uniref:glycosyltransferase n=1 Tax=Chelativorans sp. AA-79 TaxID=3028735 RepID=UPI0023F80820|nr:glycosyltransferase [Chelativorans sp. AA-79]WEX08341.1 glycosyltransferase [Chelativorans sp. AA-79]